jgi:hypothetical protein
MHNGQTFLLNHSRARIWAYEFAGLRNEKPRLS